MKFVIEHLEPELYEWCILEYKHISEIVGKEGLIFTNILNQGLEGLGDIRKEKAEKLNFKNACILDPLAKKTLSPDDKFDFLIFGGILGTNPLAGRTKKELSSKIKCQTRNLGSKQMSTDTAVYVAKKISKGTPIEKIQFQDGIEIPLDKGESMQLPFRYVLIEGKPLLPVGMKKILRNGF